MDLASIYGAKLLVHGQGEQVRQAWGAFVAEVDRAIEK